MENGGSGGYFSLLT